MAFCSWCHYIKIIICSTLSKFVTFRLIFALIWTKSFWGNEIFFFIIPISKNLTIHFKITFKFELIFVPSLLFDYIIFIFPAISHKSIIFPPANINPSILFNKPAKAIPAQFSSLTFVNIAILINISNETSTDIHVILANFLTLSTFIPQFSTYVTFGNISYTNGDDVIFDQLEYV